MDDTRKTYIIFVIANTKMNILYGLVICGARSGEEAIGMAWLQASNEWKNLEIRLTPKSFTPAVIENKEIFLRILEKIDNNTGKKISFPFMVGISEELTKK